MKLVANKYKPNELLRIIRDYTGLSQNDFGKKIHRSERSVRALELGENHITVQTLFDIANTFGIKIIIEKEKQ